MEKEPRWIIYNDYGATFNVCLATETEKIWRRADDTKAYPRVFDKRRVRGDYATEAEARTRIAKVKALIEQRREEEQRRVEALEKWRFATRLHMEDIFAESSDGPRG